jgi:deoxyribodipyrimidine photolyase-related protein
MILLILPNQLFPLQMLSLKDIKLIYLIEEPRYFTDFRFHKLKLIYHRASMKKYMNDIIKKSIKCIYIDYSNVNDDFYKEINKKEITYFNPIDHKLEKKFNKLLSNATIVDNLNFLLKPEEIVENKNKFYKNNKYHHDMFYKFQREKLDILIENNKPIGGKWSFDSENRKSLPNDISIPKLPKIKKDKYYNEALEYINKHFTKNYGETVEWNFPIDTKNSILWLKDFMKKRLPLFGEYEDAVNTEHPFLFHSVLSPMMNIGILPDIKVISIVTKYYEKNKKKIPLASYEGFIRQIIGWRNYMYSIYILEKNIYKQNFLNHTKKIDESYWLATTEITPIDSIIKNIVKYAYAHHIERLMYLGNWFLINQIDPKEVYRIFMEWTVDSYDWVMAPNIYGMSQYADGGMITSRIYFASSNYIIKMSKFKKDNKWDKIFDAIYYSFIDKHYELLKKNYATSRQTIHWKNKTENQKKELLDIAKKYQLVKK